PEVPTVDEAGAPGVYISTWYGLWVPKGTPPEAIRKLTIAAMDALADPTVRQRLTDLGQEIPPPEQPTPEPLAAHQKVEMEKWWPLIVAHNIKAECIPHGSHRPQRTSCRPVIGRTHRYWGGTRSHRRPRARARRRGRGLRRRGMPRLSWPDRDPYSSR